jgi:integrase
VKTSDLCREHGISAATFYGWKSKYGGMDASEAQRLKALEDENRRLKLLVAELSLHGEALKAGTGRVIPLSQRAMAAMTFWATHFPERKPEHYVFPAERYGAAGDVFCAKAYDVDPSKPIGSIKEAWEAAKLRAGRILAGESKETDSKAKFAPLVCRFHDLRHTAVSRMLNAGIPIAKVAKIAGWSPATMVRMAARYGHFSLIDLRGAVESISGNGIEVVSPVFSPVSENAAKMNRAN